MKPLGLCGGAWTLAVRCRGSAPERCWQWSRTTSSMASGGRGRNRVVRLAGVLADVARRGSRSEDLDSRPSAGSTSLRAQVEHGFDDGALVVEVGFDLEIHGVFFGAFFWLLFIKIPRVGFFHAHESPVVRPAKVRVKSGLRFTTHRVLNSMLSVGGGQFTTHLVAIRDVRVDGPNGLRPGFLQDAHDFVKQTIGVCSGRRYLVPGRVRFLRFAFAHGCTRNVSATRIHPDPRHNPLPGEVA